MAEENNTKKWIMWGCGGCLGLVLIIAIVAAVAGASCVGSFQKGSEEAFHKIYGDKTTPPAGYLLIALPMPEGNVVTLTSTEKKLSIIAVDNEATDEQLKIIKEGSPEQLSAMMQARGASSGSNSIAIESQHTATLANGKTIPVAYGTIEKEGETHPAVISLIPQDGRLVYVMSMGLQSTGDQKALEADMLKIVNDSELDDRIP